MLDPELEKFYEEIAEKGIRAFKSGQLKSAENYKIFRFSPTKFEHFIWFIRKIYLRFLYLFTDKVVYRSCSTHYSKFRGCKHCRHTYWAKPCKDETLPMTGDNTYSYWPHLKYLGKEKDLERRGVTGA